MDTLTHPSRAGEAKRIAACDTWMVIVMDGPDNWTSYCGLRGATPHLGYLRARRSAHAAILARPGAVSQVYADLPGGPVPVIPQGRHRNLPLGWEDAVPYEPIAA